MGFSLNDAVKPQTTELNKTAKIHSNELSPTKRLYVEESKGKLEMKDILALLKNIGKIYKLPFSMMKTVKLIKKDTPRRSHRISKESFNGLKELLDSAGVDDIGFFEVTPERLFKGCGVPYKYALVLSSKMDFNKFLDAPSMACQLEVAQVYSSTGDIANKAAAFLQEKGFGASPNHSMGGQLDYSMAAEWAGIAVTGRHSMAITKTNGPCHRISVVYTEIENLSEFISQNSHDMSWIKKFCEKCGKCIRACPTNAILEKPIAIDGNNPTRIDYDKCCEGFMNYGCGICIKECPFSKVGYDKLQQSFHRMSAKEKGEGKNGE